MKVLFAILLLAPVWCQDETLASARLTDTVQKAELSPDPSYRPREDDIEELDGELGTRSDPFGTSPEEVERIRSADYRPELLLKEEDGADVSFGALSQNKCYLPAEEEAKKANHVMALCSELAPYQLDKCNPRYWLQYYYIVNIGNYKCKPHNKYPIVRSGCQGSCRSFSSYYPFSKYTSKKFCQCCEADSLMMGYVILECWPIEWPSDIKPYSKLVWYKYPIIGSCDCQQCNDFHYWEKNQDLAVEGLESSFK